MKGFGTNGYRSNTVVTYFRIRHETQWRDRNYPGTWYCWNKSIKAQRFLKSTGEAYWRFMSDNAIPKEPQACGWRAA